MDPPSDRKMVEPLDKIMSHGSEFRGYAGQCMAAAKSAMDENTRTMWLDMAQDWLQFAAKADAKATTQQQQQVLLEPLTKSQD